MAADGFHIKKYSGPEGKNITAWWITRAQEKHFPCTTKNQTIESTAMAARKEKKSQYGIHLFYKGGMS
ncbi:MAG: hypothetical protein R6V15_00425 [Desulfotignum sp.]